MLITQQLATSAIIAQGHYLTAVHDIAQAWTGIGAAIYAVWKQTRVASSTWTLLGVVSYLACVSTLHIASTAIMQFTAFNSSSIITMQSAMAFPNGTVLANQTWQNTFSVIPPSSFLSSIQTIGLSNNTLYDIVTTTNPSLTNATVNATSLQANCGLLSNLTLNDSGPLSTLNFSGNGFRSGGFEFSNDGRFFKWSIKCKFKSTLSGQFERNQNYFILMEDPSMFNVITILFLLLQWFSKT